MDRSPAWARRRSDGGQVVFEGTPADLVATHSTPTGRHLAEYVTV
ncbi:MAG: hypothetical protein QM628_09340 [Propionicimonas sp.]